MEFEIEQIDDPYCKDITEVLFLWQQIPGLTCSVKEYWDYLRRNWIHIGLFVIRRDGVIVGFTQAECPGRLEPKTAWLQFSRVMPCCPHSESVKCFNKAVEWMKGFGSTKMKFTTVRNVKALCRLWGMKVSDEILLEKDI
jgi:hypothetical protein